MMHRVVVVVCVLAATCTARYCSNPPPMIGILRRGIDITKLDILPLDFNQHHGYMSPIFDYTCDEGKKWTSSTNRVYDLPDQILNISQLPGGWSNPNTQIFKDFHEVKESMASSVGVGLNILKGAFSDSHYYKTNQNKITNASKYIEEVSSYISNQRVQLFIPRLQKIRSDSQTFVDKILQSDFNGTTAAAYFWFISHFGTHVFQSAKFGGIVKLHLETASDYYKGKSNRDVEMQAEASFMNTVSVKGRYQLPWAKVFYQQSKRRVDEIFKGKTTQTLRYN